MFLRKGMLRAVSHQFSSEVFRCKWTVPIIVSMVDGPRRFADLAKSLGISQKVLAHKLSNLMKHQLVSMDVSGYILTEKGREIGELVKPLLPHVPSHVLAEVLKCKWSKEILQTLGDGPLHSAELVDSLPGLSWKIASDRLRKLCRHGLVERMVQTCESPIRVQYSLTPRGRLLAAWLNAFHKPGTQTLYTVGASA
ncbi:transcriptional regulator, HxlR family [Candidatus Caldarchaeum subterraneum]|uniref:Transcriptional regulator, HxlR family n=1 Tax=Caldiarchaeum subterraneum TaxID=311458 RepID=E6N677_CALS0|nr:transcriptional regulator, HxlR family [Candidatus Caldarchaeum subterraneum]BAJ50702.1 transcriptional regulator, HxlR family [Candidatus Caldarchaeum subterraneum]